MFVFFQIECVKLIHVRDQSPLVKHLDVINLEHFILKSDDYLVINVEIKIILAFGEKVAEVYNRKSAI